MTVLPDIQMEFWRKKMSRYRYSRYEIKEINLLLYGW